MWKWTPFYVQPYWENTQIIPQYQFNGSNSEPEYQTYLQSCNSREAIGPGWEEEVLIHSFFLKFVNNSHLVYGMTQIFSVCRVGLIFLMVIFEAAILKCSEFVICNCRRHIKDMILCCVFLLHLLNVRFIYLFICLF